MALRANTLVNGEWTTTTFNVDHVLRAHNNKPETPDLMDVEKPPILGLLTQTVIRSPLVHWILPARLRGPKIHDVAFIGDDFVQIKELRPDGLLWDVIRKENFGTRIRNACVVGSVDAYLRDTDVVNGAVNGTPKVKDEDDDIYMPASESPRADSAGDVLPPQYLLLQLQTGDSIFLMLHQTANGGMELVSNRYRVSRVMLNLQPGMHLAVDPSSRYMAIGCSEGVFAVYSLHSRDELKTQFSEGLNLRYVEAETYIYFTGVLIKMEFLYPSPDDAGHVILLALVVIKGRTRMLTWEWETGSELKHIRARSLKGHLLEEKRRMPELLIPLRAKSAFILVCGNTMAICEDLLLGSPNFVDFNNNVDPPTTYHHGSGSPLWTAWARPIRFPARTKVVDDIYLVREDGIIKILEVDMSDATVDLNNVIGELKANCGRALACLEPPKMDRDLLVTGGDSCSGGTYLVAARSYPAFQEPIQNWSPSQDFVTTYEDQERDVGDRYSKPRNSGLIPKPDRIFSCGGKGMKGAITEFRHGLEASIGLEMDYDISITDAWVLYPDPENIDDYGVSFFLMAVEDRSAVLRLAADAADVRELDQDSTVFDLGFRTITARMQGRSMIQVTEKSIVEITGSTCHTYTADQLLDVRSEGVLLGCGGSIFSSAIGGRVVIFTTYLDQSVWLQLLDLEDTSTSMQVDSGAAAAPKGCVRTIGQFSSNVSGLNIATVNSVLCAIVAEQSYESFTLSFVPLLEGETKVVSIPPTYGNKKTRLEGIVSIAISPDVPGHILLLCGTRNGVLIILELDRGTLKVITSRYYRIGATSAVVTIDEHIEDLFFVNCGSKLYAIRPEMSKGSAFSPRRWLHQTQIHQVWLCDNARPEYHAPKINSTARIRPSVSGGIGGSMLFVAGSQLLIARLSMQPKAVPRHLVIECTPTRLLYSSALQVLVVAASLNGKSTLLFFDPDTGCNLSEPIDQKTKAPIDFVSGLGNISERIFRLFEWTFEKGKMKWYYIIVATSSGRVLVICIENLDQFREQMQKASRREHDGDRGKGVEMPKIRYFLKHKFKGRDDATAAVGYPDGIIWSHGNLVLVEALNVTEKKFETIGKYRLPSPAINLSYENGKIYVLTKLHSLEILQMVPGPDGLEITRTHGDPLGRAALHHTIIDQPTSRPIHLISDKMTSLVGLWPTENTKADTLEPVFEAQLPYSVLRFRVGRCRPIWDPFWTSTGRAMHSTDQIMSLEDLPNAASRTETLGLSMNGSLSHYTILDAATWEFLRFLIDLAIRSPKVCEFTYKDFPVPLGVVGPVTDPKIMMHIDGDILRRCLELRVLEDLLRLGTKTQEARMVFSRFLQLLETLHLGTLPKNAAPLLYVEQAYADLAFLLRPVL